MENIAPIIHIKHQIRQIISQAYKQLRANVSESEWREFEIFFWKIRPLVDIDYTKIGNQMYSETSGPNSVEKPKENLTPTT
jgi:uncharacterized protein YpuA (DUF1002 family)